MNKIKLTMLLITTALFLTACQDKEAGKLDNRVLAYWNFKINKDFKSAYQYLSPGWKSGEREEAYIRRMSQSTVDWLDAKLIDKKCSEKDLCELTIEITYEYMFQGVMGKKMKVDSRSKENWIMIDNTWYNVLTRKT